MSTEEQQSGSEPEIAETDSVEPEIVETDSVEPDIDQPGIDEPAQPGGALARMRRNRGVTLTAAILLVSALTAGSVYWWVYRTDRMTGEAAQEEVLAAARAGAEAVLTYSPDSVDKNLADAKSHLTGAFLEKYSDFADKVVRPATRERGVKTEATVARAAVSAMHPDTAQVLLFVNQVTTSKERPTPALATSSVMMTLQRSGDQWLISEFNPI